MQLFIKRLFKKKPIQTNKQNQKQMPCTKTVQTSSVPNDFNFGGKSPVGTRPKHFRMNVSDAQQAGRIRISQTLSRKEAYGRIQQRLPVGVNILVWSSTSTRATHVFSRDTRVLTFWFTCKYHGSRPFFLDIPSVAIIYRDTNNFTV